MNEIQEIENVIKSYLKGQTIRDDLHTKCESLIQSYLDSDRERHYLFEPIVDRNLNEPKFKQQCNEFLAWSPKIIFDSHLEEWIIKKFLDTTDYYDQDFKLLDKDGISKLGKSKVLYRSNIKHHSILASTFNSIITPLHFSHEGLAKELLDLEKDKTAGWVYFTDNYSRQAHVTVYSGSMISDSDGRNLRWSHAYNRYFQSMEKLDLLFKTCAHFALIPKSKEWALVHTSSQDIRSLEIVLHGNDEIFLEMMNKPILQKLLATR